MNTVWPFDLGVHVHRCRVGFIAMCSLRGIRAAILIASASYRAELARLGLPSLVVPQFESSQ